MMTKVRNSNVELLRIFSMFLIIIFHCVYKSGFVFESTLGINEIIIKVFWFFGELGVNLFILVMGYFLINGTFKLRKLVLLIFEVLFYYLLIVCFSIWLGIYEINGIKDLFLSFFPVILRRYWFITAYIIVYILSPYLNIFAKSMLEKDYKSFLLILVIIYSIIPTFFGVFYNTTESLLFYNRLIWFIIMYFIGAYIRIFSIELLKKQRKTILLSVASFLFLFVSVLIIDEFYYFFNRIGITEFAYLWTPNNFPMLILSIAIFYMFLNFKVKNSKIINKIASTTLGIYLLHDNGIITGWLWKTIFKAAEYQTSSFVVIYVLLISSFIFIIGMIIDLFRQLLEKNILNRILDSKFIDKKIKKIFSICSKMLKIEEKDCNNYLKR